MRISLAFVQFHLTFYKHLWKKPELLSFTFEIFLLTIKICITYAWSFGQSWSSGFSSWLHVHRQVVGSLVCHFVGHGFAHVPLQLVWFFKVTIVSPPCVVTLTLTSSNVSNVQFLIAGLKPLTAPWHWFSSTKYGNPSPFTETICG